MSQIDWIDRTSYSVGERDQIEPRTWELLLPLCSIVVTRHIQYGDNWVLRCQDIGVDKKTLEATEGDAAKLEGVKVVHDILRRMKLSVEEYMTQQLSKELKHESQKQSQLS